MSRAPHPSSPAQPAARPRRRWGCWLVIAFIIAFFAIGFWAMQKEAEAWQRLRPADVSADKWSERLGLCKEASIEMQQCASQPMKTIKAAVEQVRAERHAAFCAKDAIGLAGQHAEEAVRANLKSPASADFAAADRRVTHDGCVYTVRGTVDAQNGFGALLRSNYRVKLLRMENDEWLVTKVSID
ncbi:hypothetical protein BV96_02446 [Sphingomonas paucimobilis]|nr:hypothetical protein BV96_02446 [Sphingomonas paucimobilis]